MHTEEKCCNSKPLSQAKGILRNIADGMLDAFNSTEHMAVTKHIHHLEEGGRGGGRRERRREGREKGEGRKRGQDEIPINTKQKLFNNITPFII